MKMKHVGIGMLVAGSMGTMVGVSFGDAGAAFSSAACNTGSDAAAPVKPQPGPTVEKQYFTKLNDRIDPGNLNAACGTKITTAYTTTWHGHWIDLGVGEPGIASTDQDNCSQLISQVKMRCGGSEDAKKSIAAKIKKIECSYQATPGTKVELKGTTLVGSIGPKACASDIADPANKLFDAKL